MKDTPIWKLLLKLAPPVMLALLIASIYNIVDSFFISRVSANGLTALSIIYPIQLLMTAISTGTGSGLNVIVSRMDGSGHTDGQNDVVRSGLVLGAINYALFTIIGLAGIQLFMNVSSDIAEVRSMGVQYGQIIILFGLGMFMEANCTKLLQAKGRMKLPMAAQIAGAGINILLDPALIFGLPGIPAMGVAGAAAATVIGQWAAFIIVFIGVLKTFPMNGKFRIRHCLRIYREGLPSISLQSLYTVYIMGLNLVLKTFTEDAVTVLGIYYKEQSFFMIPLMGLQQVILPIISYNYGAGRLDRIRQTFWYSVIPSAIVMAAATVGYILFPGELTAIFSDKPEVIGIGAVGLRIISLSYVPLVFSMIFPIFFQGINRPLASIALTVLRMVVLFVPVAWLLHYAGLQYVWFTFPITDSIITITGFVLYKLNMSRLKYTLKPLE